MVLLGWSRWEWNDIRTAATCATLTSVLRMCVVVGDHEWREGHWTRSAEWHEEGGG
jgi:hypothetical protein